jgi:hypothetical protein
MILERRILVFALLSSLLLMSFTVSIKGHSGDVLGPAWTSTAPTIDGTIGTVMVGEFPTIEPELSPDLKKLLGTAGYCGSKVAAKSFSPTRESPIQPQYVLKSLEDALS